jgi:DNA-binding transcriptional MerR regulator
MKAMTIGAAAEATGVKVPTIRYYEGIGLLPRASRTGSNRRLYGAADFDRLRFIRHARELGFEVEAIRALLDLQGRPDISCTSADAIARAHLSEVERRIESLSTLKRELQRMIESCGRGRVAECRIIEVLQDHAQCRHHDTPTRRRPKARPDRP